MKKVLLKQISEEAAGNNENEVNNTVIEAESHNMEDGDNDNEVSFRNVHEESVCDPSFEASEVHVCRGLC